MQAEDLFSRVHNRHPKRGQKAKSNKAGPRSFVPNVEKVFTPLNAGTEQTAKSGFVIFFSPMKWFHSQVTNTHPEVPGQGGREGWHYKWVAKCSERET